MSDVPLPPHKLLESPNSRTIELYGWSITASTNPISNAPECDALNAAFGVPLPEMTFGNNVLTLEHKPSEWKYAFTTPGALGGVKNGELVDGDGGVKVGYADKWLQSRTDSSTFSMPKTVAKPYDWTYTTTYPGHQYQEDEDNASPASSTSSLLTAVEATSRPGPSCETIPWIAADLEDTSQTIPMAELTRQDPILFYAEIPLFEDELHDNGSSILLVRIRVMPTCFFILSRFTLRVDNVLFRQFDTRIFHSFARSPTTIIRETSGWEAPYERVQRQLPRREDLHPLTDPAFIAKALSEMPTRVSQREGAKTGWRALGTRREIVRLTPTSASAPA